jgi:hypothetical protein
VAIVFLSYRHENDAHRERVRTLGGQLRDAGISVVLDQFFFDQNPAGPDEGWPAWSKRQAANTEKVLIIASAGWFRCYEGTEVPGSGRGAAAETRVIAQRLYNEAGVNPFARVVVFDPVDAQGIPLDLQGYHRFDPAHDLAAMIAWITGAAPAVPAPTVEWPAAPPIFEWEPADCEPVRDAFTRLLTAGTPHRVLLVRGVSGTGKSHLTRHLLGLALRCEWLACGRFDLKSGADLEGEFARFVAHLGVDETVKATAGQPLRARLDAVLAALREHRRPTLLFFDTFEQGGDLARWVEESALLAVPRAPWLRILIAGQQVPNPGGGPWADFAAPILQLQQLGWEDWYRYGRRYHTDLTKQFAQQLHKLVSGKHSQLGQLLGPAA